MDDLIRRSDAMAFQNEVEPMLCKSPITGEVFSASKDTDLVAYFDSIPAVDAVEVVHSSWGKDPVAAECMNCGAIFPAFLRFHEWCPNCGARMDGEEEHNAAD